MKFDSVIRLMLLGCCVVLLPPTAGAQTTCPAVKIEAVRMTDLNIPRAGHATLQTGDELFVVGGHTDGFVPTKTAEYLKDDQWNTVETVYFHDHGFTVPLQSGLVLVAGGHEKDLGIGQIFSVERYNPATHTFEGFGCLDTKRCFAEGLELDSAHVVISGNWYCDDAIEMFDGVSAFKPIKKTAQQRSCPYIFRTAKNNAMILSGLDYHGNNLDTIIVDQLFGDTLSIPILKEWYPQRILLERNTHQSFIGDNSAGQYAYLMLVMNKAEKLAVAHVHGKEIDLLPTAYPIPQEHNGQQITYFTSLIADRQARCAYIIGRDDYKSLYVVAVDYAKAIESRGATPAPLTLYYTEPLPEVGWETPVLTAEGNIVIAGGLLGDNFHTTKAVWLLPVGEPKTAASAASWWLWALIAIALAATGYGFYRYNLQRKRNTGNEVFPVTDMPVGTGDQELMGRICTLMEQEQLYLRRDIKISDLATELGTNITYVSECIRQCRGCTFPQFVANYRVEYAKQLLLQNPNKKISNVCDEAGFPTETTFFRTFKKVTGMSPSEWAAQNKKG